MIIFMLLVAIVSLIVTFSLLGALLKCQKNLINVISLLTILRQHHPECSKDIDEIIDYIEMNL